MSFAKMTIWALDSYAKAHGDDLFGLLNVPEGIDKDTLVDNIKLKAGECPCLYADADFLKESIGVWSRKWQRTFEKWAAALKIEYSPLENYDRYEEYSDSSSGSSHSTANDSTHATGNGDTDHLRSSYDSDSYQPHDKDVTSSGSDSTSDAESSAVNESQSSHTGHLHGNIGVTTSQQMLESELSIAEWNVYEHITDLFLEEFILLIY